MRVGDLPQDREVPGAGLFDLASDCRTLWFLGRCPESFEVKGTEGQTETDQTVYGFFAVLPKAGRAVSSQPSTVSAAIAFFSASRALDLAFASVCSCASATASLDGNRAWWYFGMILAIIYEIG